MATFTDRLLLVVDAVTKNAQSQLGGLTKSLQTTDQAAERTAGKGQLLAKGWETVKSSGLLAGASVAAVGKLAADSLKAFEDLSKESVNMADSLGLSTDEASRWIAVADD